MAMQGRNQNNTNEIKTTKEGYLMDGFVVDENENEEAEGNKGGKESSRKKAKKGSTKTTTILYSSNLMERNNSSIEGDLNNESALTKGSSIDSSVELKNKLEKREMISKAATSREQQVIDILYEDPSTVWYINFDQFHRDFRHQYVLRLAKEKTGRGGTIMEVMLKKSMANERTGRDKRSVGLLFEEIVELTSLSSKETQEYCMYMIKEKVLAGALINSSNEVIGPIPNCEDLASFTWEEGKPLFWITFSDIMSIIKEQTMYNIISERYQRYSYEESSEVSKTDGSNEISFVEVVDEETGKTTTRLCKVLAAKHYLEQNNLSELALLSPKDTRERLYQLFRDGLVTVREVPKRPDHNPNATFYLWNFDKQRVMNLILERLYKGIYNCKVRKTKEMKNNESILNTRVTRIKGEIELSRHNKAREILDRLDLVLTKTDETLMIYSSL